MRYIVRPWHAFHSTPMCIMVHLAALPCALGRNSPKAHSICLKPVFNLLACCLCFASLLACACYDRLEPLGGWHQLDSQLHIRQLHLMRQVIRGHQRSSAVISGCHQLDSQLHLMRQVIRGHQRSSEVIRGHQRSSGLATPPRPPPGPLRRPFGTRRHESARYRTAPAPRSRRGGCGRRGCVRTYSCPDGSTL